MVAYGPMPVLLNANCLTQQMMGPGHRLGRVRADARFIESKLSYSTNDGSRASPWSRTDRCPFYIFYT
jgi:hypothetical protein